MQKKNYCTQSDSIAGAHADSVIMSHFVMDHTVLIQTKNHLNLALKTKKTLFYVAAKKQKIHPIVMEVIQLEEFIK